MIREFLKIKILADNNFWNKVSEATIVNCNMSCETQELSEYSDLYETLIADQLSDNVKKETIVEFDKSDSKEDEFKKVTWKKRRRRSFN